MPLSSKRLPLHILFIFIDGVGLGKAEPASNPFASLDLPAFQRLGANQRWTSAVQFHKNKQHVFSSIDACLDIDGLPQSGTGQATLFTGVNCSKIAGRHFGPYPHSTSKPIIAEHNIFTQLHHHFPSHPTLCAFANAYPPPFFNHARARNRWTVTTLSCMEAGLAVRTEQELMAGEAITADLTGAGWREKLAMPIDLIHEAEAAKRLVKLSETHPFTLFEYYLTDKAGHSRDISVAAGVLQSLDRFFAGLVDNLDLSKTLLLITSDHGNLEDLSTKSHTLNPVPLVVMGKGAHIFAEINSITEITPKIVETLQTFGRI